MEDVSPKDAVGERELVDCIVSILLKGALGVVLESAYQSKVPKVVHGRFIVYPARCSD
jgi:hypothetical protein